MISKRNFNYLFSLSAILVFAGTVMEIVNNTYGRYLFSVGALGIIILQTIQASASSNSPRMTRLHRINFLASLLLGLGAYFMFIGSNSWVVAVLIYSVVTAVLSFRGE